MTLSHHSSVLASVSLCLLCFSLAGCGGSDSSTGPSVSTNEIERYIQENPDKISGPEDSPVDEAAEFAAGNG